MDKNNHNWDAEEMLFFLLFYAMSNTKPPFDIQPCCTDQLTQHYADAKRRTGKVHDGH